MKEGLKLRDYQIDDLANLMVNDRWALLHSPGTGKTPPVCVYLYWLWVEKQCRSVWVMPKSLLGKNKQELLDWTDFESSEIIIVDGTPKQRQTQMESGAKVFLFGFDMWKKSWRDMLKRYPDIDCQVVDEFHMGYSTHSSQRTQELYKAARRIRRFVPMTGSAIRGRLNSVYPMIHIIEPRYYGSHTAFMNEHAVCDYYGTVLSWTGHEKISNILKNHGNRRSFQEVYGAEQKVILIEDIVMSPKHREAYDKWHDEAMLVLENELSDVIVGVNEAVSLMRARQILAHPGEWGLVNGPSTKDERLQVHLSDHAMSGEPLVIYSVFQNEQERIRELVEKSGMTVGLINANTSTKERVRIDECFRKGTLQVIVASPATAAVGFNWGHCDHCIFTTVDYQDDNFFQAYRRFIRGKRSSPLLITILRYTNSVENQILKVIERKSLDAHKVDPTQELIRFAA